jgi:sucrose synthase
MYSNPKVFSGALLDFFKNCSIGGMTILANDHLATADVLLEELNYVRSLLDDHIPDEPYVSLAHELRVHGFEAGWGCDARSIGDNLTRLAQVLESPDPDRMEALFARLPLIRTVLMVSPHGWFAQEGVLGKPDTGGQVTYVLDQARALENVMRQRFTNSGLDIHPRVVILTRLIPDAEGTTCNVPREKIMGTEDSWIIRAPFHDESGELINQWISRFHIWPHLERFTQESQHLVVTECLGRPDLIIGHYTDGNLVAHRLADELGVTHCACVHALEKTKYLLSDMHWGGMEHDYRFSMQFTADLIAYNAADFILASSYREVGGTSAEMGMIESYEMFSMPGLYRVRSGFDPRLARHNIVPPGASEEYFFPYHEHNQRVEPVAAELRKRLLGEEPGPSDVGRLAYPERPPVFAMARMDRIKNLPGLVEMFGTSESLRERANLLLISSITNASLSQDQEEIEQIHRTYELIDRYQLDGHIRWCAARLDKSETGEIYRVVADMGGLFAQPAFMETFGLTVVEAMACGLPVVVTCFGGPSEIVVHGLSGLVVNPNDQEAYADAMESVIRDSDRWHCFSEEGIRRVQEAFTWPRHATSVLRLANVYSYWNYLDVMNRQALDQYIHTLYHTVYRPRTQAMLQAE